MTFDDMPPLPPKAETFREYVSLTADELDAYARGYWRFLADGVALTVARCAELEAENARLSADFKAMAANLNEQYSRRRPKNPPNYRYERAAD